MGRFSRFDITEIEVEWNGAVRFCRLGVHCPATNDSDSTPSLLTYGGFGIGLYCRR